MGALRTVPYALYFLHAKGFKYVSTTPHGTAS